MQNPLKILYVASEVAPLISTGGLAEVAHSLPKALHDQGHDVRIALPCYDALPPESRGEHLCTCSANLGTKMVDGALRRSVLPGTKIPVYLVEHYDYFERGHPYLDGDKEFPDNAERFCFFSMALLDGVAQTGWKPDIVHCNDWHTAPIPAYIKTGRVQDAFWSGMPSLFTIHNLAYQGRYGASYLSQTGFGWDLFKPDCLEFYGDINLMKAGIAFADRLNTVSPTYAEEIQTPDFGAGLDGFLRTRREDLCGILNGVDYDRWNPVGDKELAATYSKDDLSGKARCKAAMQKELGLQQKPTVPLVSLITRLDWQKGIDLVMAALPHILQEEVQVVVLGSGDSEMEESLLELAKKFPENLKVVIKFDIAMSHRLQGASDFLLMPSRFEPCGLTQMYSMAYGTIPIVRRTGGLADTVRDMDAKGEAGDGIVFELATAGAIVEAVERALDLYADDAAFQAARLAGMAQDYSWRRSSETYVDLYRKAMAVS